MSGTSTPSALGSFLLPPGYRRPTSAALLHEAGVVGEAGRYAATSLAAWRGRRDTSYAARSTGRLPGRDCDPVLLVPGFLAGDYTLRALSHTLRERGFRTYRSAITVNAGCTLDAVAGLECRLESIALRRQSRVQIVGHSLGGMLARGLAVRRPDLVSGIVTMGSPMMAPGAHHPLLSAGVDVLNRLSRAGVPGLMSEECSAGACARESFEESRQPVPTGVGFTAIWSRHDGIVDPAACRDPGAQCVEVAASHCGMAIDPRVADQVVAALLRQTDHVTPRTPLIDVSDLEADRGLGA